MKGPRMNTHQERAFRPDGDKDDLVPMPLRVKNELKGSWVGKSRAAGMKLTDWIVGKVTGPEEVFDFLEELAAAEIRISNIEEMVRQLVTSANWRNTFAELTQVGRKVGVVVSSPDSTEHQAQLRRLLSSFRFDERMSSTIVRNVVEG